MERNKLFLSILFPEALQPSLPSKHLSYIRIQLTQSSQDPNPSVFLLHPMHMPVTLLSGCLSHLEVDDKHLGSCSFSALYPLVTVAQLMVFEWVVESPVLPGAVFNLFCIYQIRNALVHFEKCIRKGHRKKIQLKKKEVRRRSLKLSTSRVTQIFSHYPSNPYFLAPLLSSFFLISHLILKEDLK